MRAAIKSAFHNPSRGGEVIEADKGTAQGQERGEVPRPPGRRQVAAGLHGITGPIPLEHDFRMAGGDAPPGPEGQQSVGIAGAVGEPRATEEQVARLASLREVGAADVADGAAPDALDTGIIGVDPGHGIAGPTSGDALTCYGQGRRAHLRGVIPR